MTRTSSNPQTTSIPTQEPLPNQTQATKTMTSMDEPTTEPIAPPPPPPPPSSSSTTTTPTTTTLCNTNDSNNSPPSQPEKDCDPCCPPFHIKIFSTYLPPYPLFCSKHPVKIQHTDEYLSTLSKKLDEIDQWIQTSSQSSSPQDPSVKAKILMQELLTEANYRQGPTIADETIQVIQTHIRVLQHIHQLNQIRLHSSLIHGLKVLPTHSFPQLFAPRIIRDLISTHFKLQSMTTTPMPSEPTSSERAYMNALTAQMDQCEEFINEYVLMQQEGTCMTSDDVINKVQQCVNSFYDRLKSLLHQYQPQWIVHTNDTPGHVWLFHMKMMSRIHRLDYILSPTLIHMEQLTHVSTTIQTFVSPRIWEVPRMKDVSTLVQHVIRLQCGIETIRQQHQQLLTQLQTLEQERDQLETEASTPEHSWISTMFADSVISSLIRTDSTSTNTTKNIMTTKTTIPSSSAIDTPSQLQSRPQSHSSSFTTTPDPYPHALHIRPDHATICYYGDKYDSIPRTLPLQVVHLECSALPSKPSSAQQNKELAKQRWAKLRSLCNITYDDQDIAYIVYKSSSVQHDGDNDDDGDKTKQKVSLAHLDPSCCYHFYYYHKHRSGRYIVYNVYDKDVLTTMNKIPNVEYFSRQKCTSTGLPDEPDKPNNASNKTKIINHLLQKFNLDSSQHISIYRSVDAIEWERVIGKNHIDRQSNADRDKYYYYVMPKNSIVNTIEYNTSRRRRPIHHDEDDDEDHGDSNHDNETEDDDDDHHDCQSQDSRDRSSNQSQRTKSSKRVKRKLSMSAAAAEEKAEQDVQNMIKKRKSARHSA